LIGFIGHLAEVHTFDVKVFSHIVKRGVCS